MFWRIPFFYFALLALIVAEALSRTSLIGDDEIS